MEVEAALFPPRIRLDYSLKTYAFRALNLPRDHPIYLAIYSNYSLDRDLEDYESSSIRESKTIRETQISRIRGSIEGLVDYNSLEPIEYYRYPPWDRVPPYSVEISSLSKEQEAKAHLAIVPRLRIATIYSDASAISTPEAIGIGTGIVILDSKSPNPTYSERTNIGPSQLVYNGELEAIARAAEVASYRAQPDYKYRIYSDSKASLLRLAKRSDLLGQARQIRVDKAYRLARKKGSDLSFHGVPRHIDTLGNKLADSLAKEVTRDIPLDSEASLGYLGTKIRATAIEAWGDYLKGLKASRNLELYRAIYPWAQSTRLKLPQGVKQELASTLYQLKLGHSYMRSYLYRLGYTSTELCTCGKRQSPRHLLLDCPRYSCPRARLGDSLGIKDLNLPLLLYTKLGIEGTLEFLRETKILTRRWFLGQLDLDDLD